MASEGTYRSHQGGQVGETRQPRQAEANNSRRGADQGRAATEPGGKGEPWPEAKEARLLNRPRPASTPCSPLCSRPLLAPSAPVALAGRAPPFASRVSKATERFTSSAKAGLLQAPDAGFSQGHHNALEPRWVAHGRWPAAPPSQAFP